MHHLAQSGRTSWAALVVFGVLGSLLAACGSSEATAGVQADTGNGTPGVASASEDPILAAASAAQLAALQDGVVTLDEKNQAFRNMSDCLESNGIAVVSLSDDSFQTVAPKEMPAAESKVLSDGCAFEHFLGIQKQWQFQHRPSEQKLAEARTALRECLIDKGVAMPASPSASDFIQVQSKSEPKIFAACSAEVSAAFGLSNFAG